MGFLYVLNRNTGDPIYPIEERPYPKCDLPGEGLPDPALCRSARTCCPDNAAGVSILADVASFGHCSRSAKSLRDDGKFTPPIRR